MRGVVGLEPRPETRAHALGVPKIGEVHVIPLNVFTISPPCCKVSGKVWGDSITYGP